MDTQIANRDMPFDEIRRFAMRRVGRPWLSLFFAVAFGAAGCGESKGGAKHCSIDADCPLGEVCIDEICAEPNVQAPVLQEPELVLSGPTEVEAGETASFSASVKNPPTGAILFRFLLDGAEVQAFSNASSWAYRTAPGAGATHSITVEAQSVSASEGEEPEFSRSASASLAVTATPAEKTIVDAPTVKLEGPAIVDEEGEANFIATAQAADGQSVYFRFLVDEVEKLDWTVGSATAGTDVVTATFSPKFDHAFTGTAHSLKVEVSVNAGGPADSSDTLFFQVAAAPVVVNGVALMGPEELPIGATGIFWAAVDSNDPDAVFFYRFGVAVEGSTAFRFGEWAESSIFSYAPSVAEIGSRSIRVEVAKSINGEVLASATHAVNVSEDADAPSTVSISGPRTVDEGTVYAADAVVQPTPQETKYYKFEVKFKDSTSRTEELQGWSTTSSLAWDVPYDTVAAGDTQGSDKVDLMVYLSSSPTGPAEAFSTREVTVSDVNRAPTVVISGPETVSAGGSPTFVATTTDEDGAAFDSNSLEKYHYFWYIDGELVDPSSNATCSSISDGGISDSYRVLGGTWTAKDEGTHTIKVRVVNHVQDDSAIDGDDCISDDELEGTGEFEVTVVAEDTPPTITVVDIKNSSGVTIVPTSAGSIATLVATADQLSLEVTANDAENSPVWARIYVVNGDGSENVILNWTRMTATNADKVFKKVATWIPGHADVGKHTVMFEVSADEEGPRSDFKSLPFEVTAPTVTLGVTGSESIVAGAPETFTATYSVSAPTSGSVLYSFKDGSDVVRDWETSDKWIFATSADDIGPHTITVEVREPGSQDVVASESKNVVVYTGNDSITFLGVSGPTSVIENTAVTYTAQVHAQGDADLEYLWIVNGFVASDWSSSPGWTWNVPCAEAVVESHKIRVQARLKDSPEITNEFDSDSSTADTIDPIAVSVDFVAPTAVEIDGPANPVVDEHALYTVSATHACAAPADLYYELRLAGATSVLKSGTRDTFSVTFEEDNVGTQNLLVQASRFSGTPTNQGSMSVTVKPGSNDPMLVRSEPSAAPAGSAVSAPKGQEKTFKVTVSDADSNDQIYFRWVLDALGAAEELVGWTPGPVLDTSSSQTTGEFTWTPAQNLGVGGHTLTVQVSDDGQTADFDVTWNIDLTDPTLTLTRISPEYAGDSAAIGEKKSFVAIAERTSVGENLVWFKYVVNDGTESGWFEENSTTHEGTFVWNVEVAAGDYTVTAYANIGGAAASTDDADAQIMWFVTVEESNPVAHIMYWGPVGGPFGDVFNKAYTVQSMAGNLGLLVQDATEMGFQEGDSAKTDLDGFTKILGVSDNVLEFGTSLSDSDDRERTLLTNVVSREYSEKRIPETHLYAKEGDAITFQAWASVLDGDIEQTSLWFKLVLDEGETNEMSFGWLAGTEDGDLGMVKQTWTPGLEDSGEHVLTIYAKAGDADNLDPEYDDVVMLPVTIAELNTDVVVTSPGSSGFRSVLEGATDEISVSFMASAEGGSGDLWFRFVLEHENGATDEVRSWKPGKPGNFPGSSYTSTWSWEEIPSPNDVGGLPILHVYVWDGGADGAQPDEFTDPSAEGQWFLDVREKEDLPAIQSVVSDPATISRGDDVTWTVVVVDDAPEDVVLSVELDDDFKAGDLATGFVTVTEVHLDKPAVNNDTATFEVPMSFDCSGKADQALRITATGEDGQQTKQVYLFKVNDLGVPSINSVTLSGGLLDADVVLNASDEQSIDELLDGENYTLTVDASAGTCGDSGLTYAFSYQAAGSDSPVLLTSAGEVGTLPVESQFISSNKTNVMYLTVSVVGPSGLAVVKNYTLLVKNPPPVIRGLNGPKAVALDKEITLAISGFDPDGDTLSYRFNIGNGLIDTTQAENLYVFTPTELAGFSAGTITVVGTILDEDGGVSGKETLDLTIEDSATPPLVTAVAVAGQDINDATGDKVEIRETLPTIVMTFNKAVQKDKAEGAISLTDKDNNPVPITDFVWNFDMEVQFSPESDLSESTGDADPDTDNDEDYHVIVSDANGYFAAGGDWFFTVADLTSPELIGITVSGTGPFDSASDITVSLEFSETMDADSADVACINIAFLIVNHSLNAVTADTCTLAADYRHIDATFSGATFTANTQFTVSVSSFKGVNGNLGDAIEDGWELDDAGSPKEPDASNDAPGKFVLPPNQGIFAKFITAP